MSKRLHVVFLGPQGSGKGTQAAKLAKRFGLVHLETGRMLRGAALEPTPLGRRIFRLMNMEGKLIPDAVVNRALAAALHRVSKTRGIVFDGYPRTLQQARTLDRLLAHGGRNLTHAVYMPLSRESTVRRLSLRRTCTQCGTPWILGRDVHSNRGSTRCPKCGGKIIQRNDDKPTTIRKRLAEYLKKTTPIIDYYRRHGILIEVNGEASIAVVWRAIQRIFG